MQFEKKIRQRNLYNPESSELYKLSRTRLDSFIQCARCFYLDRRLGVDRPSIPGYTLNSAVDSLLKNEFDSYRSQGLPHPLQTQFKTDSIPFAHDSLDDWRNVRKGIQIPHTPSGFLVTGAVDDIWVNPAGELIIVDYKATSVNAGVTAETHRHPGYCRQLEIYQWLFRQSGFSVSNTAYLVYANGLKNKPTFNNRLEFDLTLLPYQGQSGWVANKLLEAKSCLQGANIPPPSSYCKHCAYVNHVSASAST
jgi:PD-(D/E)XK nuclease superfamily